MENSKLINKYKNLRNKFILEYRKRLLPKKNNNKGTFLNLIDDIVGTYNDFIDEDIYVVVNRGIKNSYGFKTGNLDDAYCSLIEKIGNNSAANITSPEELMNILDNVYSTVIEYFGYGNLMERQDYYEFRHNVTLESLKGKNLAVCLEDAVLSQNMLKLLGIDATLKVSLVQYENGEYDTHAYNLIKFGNRYYIFDSRFPSPSFSPVVSILNEEEYLKFLSNTNEEIKITPTNNNVIYFNKNTPLNRINKAK